MDFCPPHFVIEERCTIDQKLYNNVSEDDIQIVRTDSGFVI